MFILEKKVLISRWALIVICMAIASGCYWHMNQSYDPLARYQYTTDENREVILEYLTTDDIDYMISQQIQPSQFMDFIKLEGFDIHNTAYYALAKSIQDADNEDIVSFINKYREYFNKTTLQSLLKNYVYHDLITFYENELTIQNKLTLVADPTDIDAILDDTHSVYTYAPSTLVEYNESIWVQKDMVDNLERMNASYMMMLGQPMEISYGYISYEDYSNLYAEYSTVYADTIENFMYPAGQDENQLGYTLVLNNADTWVDLCNQNLLDGVVDYTSVESGLDTFSKEEILWLEENAYRFGFVVRYPKGKEDVTGMWYQPFVLRYVGKDAARKMYKAHQTMEEFDFSSVK